MGNGKRTTIRELATWMCQLIGNNRKIRYEPETTISVRIRIGSPERARQELGFEALVALEEGLNRLIDWKRAQRLTSQSSDVIQKQRRSG